LGKCTGCDVCSHCGLGCDCEYSCVGWCSECTVTGCKSICDSAKCEKCTEDPQHYRCLKTSNCSSANCESCVNGSCKSNCDPNECKTCDGQGHCIVCNGDTNKKCCGNGTCCKNQEICCGSNCCDPNLCQICDSNGVCKSRCDPARCETCDGQGHCIVCDGDPDWKCCDGECAKKCHTVDGETCSGGPTGGGWICEGCLMPEPGGCDFGGTRTSRTYEGGTEKICDWDGCASDCHHDEKLCYTDLPCISFDVPVPLAYCAAAGIGETECASSWPIPWACYICMGDESNPQKHYVQNDSCTQ